jgi:hypothetical protein
VDINELEELLMVYLYERAEAEAHSYYFFPLNEFAISIGANDMREILETAQRLESRGLIMLSQGSPGQINALINLEGISFVEDGGKTGIIKKYRDNPEVFIKVKEEDTNIYNTIPRINVAQFIPEVTLQTSTEYVSRDTQQISTGIDAKGLILQIINVILNDDSIDAAMKEDLLRDIETVNIQLNKNIKNKMLIETLLNELSTIPSIALLVSQLSSFV